MTGRAGDTAVSECNEYRIILWRLRLSRGGPIEPRQRDKALALTGDTLAGGFIWMLQNSAPSIALNTTMDISSMLNAVPVDMFTLIS